MRIQHPRRNYTGTEIHQARRLEFVDGVAETDDSAALAAALSVKGYHQVGLAEQVSDAIRERLFGAGPEHPKRKRSKAADHSLEDDVDFTPEHEPTIDD